jgi:formate hydrogenlyase subunit 6/NADH:ubiquinone oxidoreductase subunit I
MTNEYELADESRAKLIFEKEDLLGSIEVWNVATTTSNGSRNNSY